MKILAEGDVIDVLLDQHEQIKRSLAEIAMAGGEAKAVAFLELETLLYVHETGEQQVLHPLAAEVAGDVVLAKARLREEEKIDKILGDMREIDVNHPQFAKTFAQLRTAVLRHIQHEENDEFPRLRASLRPEQLRALGDQLRDAQSIP